ncbi:Ldh family oxidoreductase [uncultured Thalassospira sp.]|uniref:Ldh family oxidoreductase n=1 Tax=uncultured Thalassospira sp. TaxID=404382 RepID=UPI0030DD9091|tara:strand:- start:4733 stop:5725 length:993 start_codon:yes stop_codon:yes gene_type:complete
MLLSLSEACHLVIDALVRNNVSALNAASVAAALVSAEAAGQGGHGLRRVEAYSKQAWAGKTDGQVSPTFSRPAPGVLAIDAAFGFAFPALDLAVAELPKIARSQGIALASIRRSHHAGVMGLTVERFAEQGLVAIMVANAPAAMAPWGGLRPMYGTNPLAFATPVPGSDPIVVDLALSKVARGKIMAAKQKGTDIPEGWALDRDGNPTTDANDALAGTMVPAGDAKGAALALMVEILSAGLTGAHFSHEATSLFDDKGAPPALGHMIIAIDPKATAPGFNPLERIAYLAGEIASDPAVRLPGRRGQTARAMAAQNGIEIEDDVIALINTL